jgi:hypothetical protein
MQRWAAAGGFQEGASPISTDLGSMDSQQVGNLLFRFFDWWIVQGRPGDDAVGGRVVSAPHHCG